jgi:hypothetical protein
VSRKISTLNYPAQVAQRIGQPVGGTWTLPTSVATLGDMKFVLDANWSTTVVKQDGRWKAAAIHFSTHLFDNALVRNAQRLAWIVGAVAFAAGLLLAFLLARLLRKK